MGLSSLAMAAVGLLATGRLIPRAKRAGNFSPGFRARTLNIVFASVSVAAYSVQLILAVVLLAYRRRTGRHQLGGPGPDEPRPLPQVPRRLAGDPDVDVHPVLGCLRLRYLVEPDANAAMRGYDDHGIVSVGMGRAFQHGRRATHVGCGGRSNSASTSSTSRSAAGGANGRWRSTSSATGPTSTARS